MGTLEDEARPRIDGRSEKPKRDFFVLSGYATSSADRRARWGKNAPSSGGIVRTDRCIIVVAGASFKSSPRQSRIISVQEFD